MQKIKQDVSELRWRVKATVGLIMLGSFFGALAWLWPALGGEADLLTLWPLLGMSAGNTYFWVVVGLCGVLGGWAAWMIFWRVRHADEPHDDGGDGGMSAPKF